MKLVLITNISTQPYFNILGKQYLNNDLIVKHILLDECHLNESINEIATSDFIVVWLNLENILSNIDNNSHFNFSEVQKEYVLSLCYKLYNDFLNLYEKKIIWFSFEDYYIQTETIVGYLYHAFADEINIKLRELLYKNNNILIDLKHLISKVGINSSYNVRTKYQWNLPYTKELFIGVLKEINKQINIIKGNTPKCLAVDCDNVLWGGVLSEDGIQNILLGGIRGQPYKEFQRFLLMLYNHGIILTICSKNDEEDVRRVFKYHSGMELKEEHISCFKVNWNNKVDNIIAISNELNISLESIVFVDDSEFEINSVKTLIPEVTTILFNCLKFHECFSMFNLNNYIDIDNVRKRVQTYQNDNQRRLLKKTSPTFNDYITSLKMNVDIHPSNIYELSRISELTHRTNKCTNGSRYTAEQLKVKLLQENYYLYTISISDKFGDLGIVGVIGVEGTNLDIFSLSCRAMGRGVENIMIEKLSELGVKTMRFYSTMKNQYIFEQLIKRFNEI